MTMPSTSRSGPASMRSGHLTTEPSLSIGGSELGSASEPATPAPPPRQRALFAPCQFASPAASTDHQSRYSSAFRSAPLCVRIAYYCVPVNCTLRFQPRIGFGERVPSQFYTYYVVLRISQNLFLCYRRSFSRSCKTSAGRRSRCCVLQTIGGRGPSRHSNFSANSAPLR
jgi:hypothetical protein